MRRRRKGQKVLELADGAFIDFVREAGYHRPDYPQERFVQIDGKIPDKVELIKFEELGVAFPEAIKPFLRTRHWGRHRSLPHRNATSYQTPDSGLLTEEVRALIQEKHRFMFDSGLYER